MKLIAKTNAKSMTKTDLRLNCLFMSDASLSSVFSALNIAKSLSRVHMHEPAFSKKADICPDCTSKMNCRYNTASGHCRVFPKTV
ncbi:MAG: hypothetical protein IKG55_04755, partial [Solobacterium sp.]|nr:hypothetical protein [Solobacterium sp.]